MNYAQLQHDAFQIAKAHGFHDTPREIGTVLMLMVSEASEALEAARKGGQADEPIEIELADFCIRIGDACGEYGIDLPKMMVEYGWPSLPQEAGSEIGSRLLWMCEPLYFAFATKDNRFMRGYYLADALARCEAIAHDLHLDLWSAILLKMNRNKLRPRMHGKAF